MMQMIIAALAAILMVVPSNIDLDNRQVITNDDDTISTEFSFSVEMDGLEVLLPAVINGEIVSEEEAVKHFFDSGEHLGMFKTKEAADVYAFCLHLRQESKYGE